MQTQLGIYTLHAQIDRNLRRLSHNSKRNHDSHTPVPADSVRSVHTAYSINQTSNVSQNLSQKKNYIYIIKPKHYSQRRPKLQPIHATHHPKLPATYTYKHRRKIHRLFHFDTLFSNLVIYVHDFGPITRNASHGRPTRSHIFSSLRCTSRLFPSATIATAYSCNVVPTR